MTSQEELDAIKAVSQAVTALQQAVRATELADYGTTYIRHPLQEALDDIRRVLQTMTE